MITRFIKLEKYIEESKYYRFTLYAISIFNMVMAVCIFLLLFYEEISEISTLSYMLSSLISIEICFLYLIHLYKNKIVIGKKNLSLFNRSTLENSYYEFIYFLRSKNGIIVNMSIILIYLPITILTYYKWIIIILLINILFIHFLLIFIKNNFDIKVSKKIIFIISFANYGLLNIDIIIYNLYGYLMLGKFNPFSSLIMYVSNKII